MNTGFARTLVVIVPAARLRATPCAALGLCTEEVVRLQEHDDAEVEEIYDDYRCRIYQR